MGLEVMIPMSDGGGKIVGMLSFGYLESCFSAGK